MKHMARTAMIVGLLVLCFGLFVGCGDKKSQADHSGPPRDSSPKVLTPSADGSVIYQNDTASIDASHTDQGYVMVSYSGSCEKVKLQITGPDQNCYTYLITDRASYVAFPLTAGNGSYSVQVLENVGGDSYVISLEQAIDVSLENEFLPFLYPNQYVSFTADSKAVAKGSKLAEDTWTDLEVVQNIYDYVIKNISYDTDKASNVSYDDNGIWARTQTGRFSGSGYEGRYDLYQLGYDKIFAKPYIIMYLYINVRHRRIKQL